MEIKDGCVDTGAFQLGLKVKRFRQRKVRVRKMGARLENTDHSSGLKLSGAQRDIGVALNHKLTLDPKNWNAHGKKS